MYPGVKNDPSNSTRKKFLGINFDSSWLQSEEQEILFYAMYIKTTSYFLPVTPRFLVESVFCS